MVKDLKVTYNAPVFNQPINGKSHQRSMSQKFEREDFKAAAAAAEAERAVGAAGSGAGKGAENGRQNHLTPAEGRRVRRSSSNH